MQPTRPGRTQASSRRREQELLAHWHATRDTRARDELVTAFTPAVRGLVRRYARSSEPVEDLMQVATLGLVKALDRYDPERGRPFMAFAVPTIVGELRRYFRDCGWAAHVPRGAKERALQVRRVKEQLTGSLGREPDVRALSERLGMELEDVLDALHALRSMDTASLDAQVSGGDEESETFVDLLGAEDRNYELVELKDATSCALRTLGPDERRLLRLRFVDELTQQEIAAQTGVSQMQVSRKLRQTLERMRTVAEAA